MLIHKKVLHQDGATPASQKWQEKEISEVWSESQYVNLESRLYFAGKTEARREFHSLEVVEIT